MAAAPASAVAATPPRFYNKQQVINIHNRVAIDVFDTDASAPGSDNGEHVIDAYASIGRDIIGAQLAQFVAAKIGP